MAGKLWRWLKGWFSPDPDDEILDDEGGCGPIMGYMNPRESADR